MKKIAKACNVAFSMYSKIPMPRFEWASEDMRYHLFFFPWIGAVIGLLEWGWYCMTEKFSIGSVLYLTMAIALPILVTGGFHLDGFMDTKDAQSSYQARDKKLVILKDPHIGAFAVIHLVLSLLLAFGFLSVIDQKTAIASLCFSFFMSRCLSGWSVLHFPAAKKEGSLYTEADTSDRRNVSIGLVLQLVIAVGVSVYCTKQYGFLVAAANLMMFLYYYRMSKRTFGGITGDLAGYYVCMAELWSVIVVGVYLVLQ
ncbi:MAG: adenosylcobinamide-GDP ribazoletransferase [Pseudobutyrivibrio sp.]|nr:adenosylcobinamide-GDP ribazoletransferase [Pseudobutyrivibrio sp.]